jgi:hypothetical protein
VRISILAGECFPRSDTLMQTGQIIVSKQCRFFAMQQFWEADVCSDKPLIFHDMIKLAKLL